MFFQRKVRCTVSRTVPIAVSVPSAGVSIAMELVSPWLIAIRCRVAVDQAVDDMNYAVSRLGHVGIVRDQHHRDSRRVELTEHIEDFDGRM